MEKNPLSHGFLEEDTQWKWNSRMPRQVTGALESVLSCLSLHGIGFKVFYSGG